MNDPLQRLIVAWSKSQQRNKKLSARQLLRQAKGSLRKALNATKATKPGRGRATKPNALGIFLNANKNMLCAGHYIRTDFDAHFQQFEYFLEKVSDDELRRLEFEASLAQDKRREAEREQRHKRLTPPNQEIVYLTPPNADWFTHERTAQRLVDNLRAAHFDASIDSGPGGELCAVRIQRSSVDDIKEYCRTHRMEFHRVREICPSQMKAKPSQSEQVWDQRMQPWLPADWNQRDHTSIRLIRRALAGGGHERTGPAIRSTPYLRFDWNVFD